MVARDRVVRTLSALANVRSRELGERTERQIARMTQCGLEGRLAVMEFFYLVGGPRGVETFTERHEVALLTDAEYREAFHSAGLVVARDEEGLIGRGLYIACWP